MERFCGVTSNRGAGMSNVSSAGDHRLCRRLQREPIAASGDRAADSRSCQESVTRRAVCRRNRAGGLIDCRDRSCRFRRPRSSSHQRSKPNKPPTRCGLVHRTVYSIPQRIGSLCSLLFGAAKPSKPFSVTQLNMPFARFLSTTSPKNRVALTTTHAKSRAERKHQCLTI